MTTRSTSRSMSRPLGTDSRVPTALITGANSGIGLAAAIELGRRGWNVAITARDPGRGEDAIRILRDAGVEAKLLQLDLASFASVRQCAADALEQLPQIDALINNAGINVSERVITEDGIERTLQVNHFGHFLLTGLLLERILESADPRVVNVTSLLHVRADPLDLGDLQLQQRWGGWSSYAASKLANVLFTRELQRRYADQGLTSIAIHPGGVRTKLGADGDMRGLIGLGWRVLQIFLLSAKKGAAPVVDAAAEPACASTAAAISTATSSPSPATPRAIPTPPRRSGAAAPNSPTIPSPTPKRRQHDRRADPRRPPRRAPR